MFNELTVLSPLVVANFDSSGWKLQLDSHPEWPSPFRIMWLTCQKTKRQKKWQPMSHCSMQLKQPHRLNITLWKLVPTCHICQQNNVILLVRQHDHRATAVITMATLLNLPSHSWWTVSQQYTLISLVFTNATIQQTHWSTALHSVTLQVTCGGIF